MGTRNPVLMSVLVMVAILVAATVDAAPVSSRTYIVHMAMNTSHADVMAKGAWYKELMQGAKALLAEGEADDGRDCVHHVYDKVLNGFSARLTPAQAEYMATIPGVLNVFPNGEHKVSTTRSPTFLGLTAAGATLLNESNAGEGVVIGVIDTGIWPERMSFSDTGLGPVPAKWKGACEVGVEWDATHCNLKIIGARYFLKGYEATYGALDADEYRSARDLGGHGTHCASTAAGRAVTAAGAYGLATGTAMGMAPKARIAVYKALWGARGRGGTDDILMAIEAAVSDGVDVISFSIGSGPGEELYLSPFQIAAYNVVKQGVFFSAAGGNDGPTPFTIDNIAPWVTTVAASTQDRDIVAAVELGDGTQQAGRSSFDGTGLNGNAILPLVYAGDAALYTPEAWNASVCQSAAFLDVGRIQGHLVLCDFYPGWTDYSDIVTRGGAAGVIVANTPLSGEELKLFPPSAVQFTNVGNMAREAIMTYIRTTAAPAARVLPAATLIPGLKHAPQIARLSSRGPLIGSDKYEWLKPDISAPGRDILAAGVGQEEFAFMSGTSMACPHISGMGALLKAVHPHWSPAAIRSALMTTASPIDTANNTISLEESDAPGSPWEFGAGLALPERAKTPGLIYDMGPDDYFFFLCALGYTTQQIQLFEHGNFTCPPQTSVNDANLPSFVTLFDDAGMSSQIPQTMRRTLTSVSTGTHTYTATVVHPLGFKIVVDPPTLTFSPDALMQSFTVTITPDGTLDVSRYGSAGRLTWWDGAQHLVSSPLIATNVDLWYKI